jgi:hypothetical protein
MGNARRGGDRVLESRHLVGLFLGVVLLCGVFFTLGYVMGRTQYDSSVHASDVPPSPSPLSPRASAKSPETAKPPAPAPGEWDFYSKKNDDHLELPPKPAPNRPEAPAGNSGNSARAAEKRSSEESSRLPAHVRPPRMLKAAIVLQIAALRHQSDALALADALQQKRFFCCDADHRRLLPRPGWSLCERGRRGNREAPTRPPGLQNDHQTLNEPSLVHAGAARSR